MAGVPPEHDLTEPRSWFSLFRAKGGALVIIAGAFCLLMTLISVNGYRNAIQFERTGVTIVAEAVDRRIRSDSDGADDYYITYRYIVDDVTYEKSRKVSHSQYSLARPGSTHTIRYLPHRPEKFETYVGEARDDARGFQMIAGFAGVGGLIGLWFYGNRTNRSVLTRKYGYRSVATIEAITETKNSGRPSGRGYLIWRTEGGMRGESLMHPIGKLRAIGIGNLINVYIRKDHSVWEGDVGPQKLSDSQLPKVGRGAPN